MRLIRNPDGTVGLVYQNYTGKVVTTYVTCTDKEYRRFHTHTYRNDPVCLSDTCRGSMGRGSKMVLSPERDGETQLRTVTCDVCNMGAVKIPLPAGGVTYVTTSGWKR